MLRDGPTGDWLGTFVGHKGAVWSARLNKDASRAATGSADFTAKVWNTYTGDELASFAHSHIVRATDLTADGTRLFTGGHEKILRVYDLNRPGSTGTSTGSEPSPAATVIEHAHADKIKNVVWDNKRNVLLSSGEDKVIKIWDLRSNEHVRTIQASAPISSMDFSVDGDHIVFASGRSAQVWDASSYEIVKQYDMDYEVSCVSLHPSGKKFATGGSNDLWVRIYDFETGEQLELYKGHHGPVHTVCYSPDGEIYATGSEDGTIRLWQTTAGKTYGLWAEKNAGATPQTSSSSTASSGTAAPATGGGGDGSTKEEHGSRSRSSSAHGQPTSTSPQEEEARDS